MLSSVEVVLGCFLVAVAGWSKWRIAQLEVDITKRIDGKATDLQQNMIDEIRDAIEQFEIVADEVVPETPDPFEAMEIMRANMINQVLGMGVQWFANKFTNVEMGVHQLENVDKPPNQPGEAWHDVDAEPQLREELAEVADST
jgi:hypothetical protein